MPKKRAHIVSDWVQKQILTKKLLAGQRLPTEAELCQKFALSRSAVRNALSRLTEQNFLEYEKNRGYFVAGRSPSVEQNASSAERLNLGLLCFFPGHYIFSDVISGANSVLNNMQHNMIIKQSEYQVEQERKALESFLQQGISGLVAMPILHDTQAPNQDLYLEFIARKIPIVFISSAIPGLRASSILCSDEAAGCKAAEIMLQHGYKSFILFYQENYDTKASRIRAAKKYLKAYLDQAHLDKKSDIHYLELAFADQGQHSDMREKCITFFQNLSQKQAPELTEPMAWLCSSDEDALVVVEVARLYGWEMHRDYELIGFDNSQLSHFVGGGFSSFTVPGELIGRMATRYLLDQIEEESEVRHCIDLLVQSNFVQRNLHSFSELHKRKSSS